MLGGEFNRPIKQCEVVMTLFGFPQVPCALAHADRVHAEFGHAAQVIVPDGFGPLFGKVTDAVEKIFSRILAGSRRQCLR
jgi:hypothetical protein